MARNYILVENAAIAAICLFLGVTTPLVVGFEIHEIASNPQKRAAHLREISSLRERAGCQTLADRPVAYNHVREWHAIAVGIHRTARSLAGESTPMSPALERLPSYPGFVYAYEEVWRDCLTKGFMTTR